MPNHITSRITVTKGDYNLGDITSFQELVPVPDEIADLAFCDIDVVSDVEAYNGIGFHLGKKPTLKQLKEKYSSPQERKLLQQAFDNVKKYGFTSLRRWCIANWDTKWDLYSREYDEETNTLTFDTAWGYPETWAKKLAETLPDGVELKLEWADEDIGFNAGVAILKNDEYNVTDLPNETNETIEFALTLKGAIDDYYFDEEEQEWTYKDY